MSGPRHVDDDRLDVPTTIPYLGNSVVLLAGARDAALRLIGEDQAEDGRAVLTALSRRWVAQYTARHS